MNEFSSTTLYDRPQPVQWLMKWRGRDLVKVLTGIRRCGKSTVLRLFANALAADGVPPKRVVSVNFEDPDAPECASWREAWELLKPQIAGTGRTYVLLDEVQRVPEWEKLVDGLHSRKNIDVTVTGSNGSFLSGELATFLTGRYVEFPMLPLSFSEFRAALPLSAAQGGAPLSRDEAWRRYVREGGFPLSLSFGGDTGSVDQYLQGVLNTVLFRDVVEKRGFKDPALLRRILRFALDSIGSPVSVLSIVKALRSEGLHPSATTVDAYLSALCDSFLLYKADRYDIRGRAYLKTLGKYYAADTGLRFALLGTRGSDAGHILENAVYLELRRRFSEVYVGHLERGEVDFVTFAEGRPAYWQVALTVRDESTLARELAPLRSLPDHYPKTLLTLDPDPDGDFDGIRKRNALDFMEEAFVP